MRAWAQKKKRKEGGGSFADHRRPQNHRSRPFPILNPRISKTPAGGGLDEQDCHEATMAYLLLILSALKVKPTRRLEKLGCWEGWRRRGRLHFGDVVVLREPPGVLGDLLLDVGGHRVDDVAISSPLPATLELLGAPSFLRLSTNLVTESRPSPRISQALATSSSTSTSTRRREPLDAAARTPILARSLGPHALWPARPTTPLLERSRLHLHLLLPVVVVVVVVVAVAARTLVWSLAGRGALGFVPPPPTAITRQLG